MVVKRPAALDIVMRVDVDFCVANAAKSIPAGCSSVAPQP